MISKQKIKFIHSLKHNKYRIKYNCFVAEGLHVINEFIDCGFNVKYIFSTDQRALSHSKLNIISHKELLKISFLKTPSTTLAVFYKPSVNLNYSNLNQQRKIILLDSISDPGNMGTMIRTADWYGYKNIYVSQNSVDVFSPKVIQSSMGSLARVRLFSIDITSFLQELRKLDFKLFGATLKGTSLYKLEKPKQCALLFGNESRGISESLLDLLDQEIMIPSKNMLVDSLNVSVAFGIILSEFR